MAERSALTDGQQSLGFRAKLSRCGVADAKDASKGGEQATLVHEPHNARVADAHRQELPSCDAAALIPGMDALPVRVGVAVIGTVVVFGLIMVARSMNRRPQH